MKKKALLVGINRYQIDGADLRGCVNDVEQIRQVLIDYYDFSDADIAVLCDFDATKANMEAGYRQLLAGAEPGDVLFAHFSGHGSNVPDKNGDEADYRDEIVCPTDLNWRDPFLDDWFQKLFKDISPEINLTVVMDCCHSGTITRAIQPPDNTKPMERFLPYPRDLEVVESGIDLRGALRSAWSTAREALNRDVKNTEMRELLITGCQSDQTSADAYINNDYHGAMTYSLVSAIKEAKGQITYSQLHQKTKEKLAAENFHQVPQLEGRESRFDLQFLSPF